MDFQAQDILNISDNNVETWAMRKGEKMRFLPVKEFISPAGNSSEDFRWANHRILVVPNQEKPYIYVVNNQSFWRKRSSASIRSDKNHADFW